MAKFLSQSDEKKIIEAIQQAENNTSGEIRVHIEPRCKNKSPIDRAKEVFAILNMHETELHNGTLIYVSTRDKQIAIWGGEGINQKVGQDFWEDELTVLTGHFKQGRYAEGLSTAVLHIGEKLKAFFPYQKDDINELPDDISYGDEDE